MRFSQRIKKTVIKTELQIESMDDELRIGLWNIFDLCFLRPFGTSMHYESGETFFKILYLHHLKLPLDTIPSYPRRHETLRQSFFEWQWYEIYDFIEFAAQVDNYNLGLNTAEFTRFCNEILERELSGYRFVNNQIVPITNEDELKEIEEAIEVSKKTKFTGVHSHLKSALTKFSDRKNPDYRNSIKESISAVESISQVISGNPKAELGQALKLIEDKAGLHPALKKGFLAIYGYTSDADGIRHAMTEEPKCDFEDAKYMLVSCSAFINYLIMKATKASIL